jgi:hypothetical protein
MMCVEREGDCFDARIDGLKVIPLRSAKVLEPYGGRLGARARRDLEQVRWQVDGAVGGGFGSKRQ